MYSIIQHCTALHRLPSLVFHCVCISYLTAEGRWELYVVVIPVQLLLSNIVSCACLAGPGHHLGCNTMKLCLGSEYCTVLYCTVLHHYHHHYYYHHYQQQPCTVYITAEIYSADSIRAFPCIYIMTIIIWTRLFLYSKMITKIITLIYIRGIYHHCNSEPLSLSTKFMICPAA